MKTTIWIIDNAPINVSNKAKEKNKRNGDLMIINLSLLIISKSDWEIYRSYKSRCRSKFYNEGLKINSNAIMKEAKGIHSKTIKEFIVKSKIVPVQKLQIYLNYFS